ncbi:hypothetical protein EJ110_NYTH56891 [Nymphaea thermarum]|nr:hypothetical protein EJ110_NYTH56891 [Nymphaea thermarum]
MPRCSRRRRKARNHPRRRRRWNRQNRRRQNRQNRRRQNWRRRRRSRWRLRHRSGDGADLATTAMELAAAELAEQMAAAAQIWRRRRSGDGGGRTPTAAQTKKLQRRRKQLQRRRQRQTNDLTFVVALIPCRNKQHTKGEEETHDIRGKPREEIMQHKWAWPFMEPVDVDGLGLHDYYKQHKVPDPGDNAKEHQNDSQARPTWLSKPHSNLRQKSSLAEAHRQSSLCGRFV